MANNSRYTVPSSGHGNTRPLSPEQKRKRAQREAVDVPLAWTLRDQIVPDPKAGIPGRPNPGFVLTASGTPEMTASIAGYLFGPQPRALLMAVRRLRRIDATAYGYLLEYYVNKQSEHEIATTNSVSRWQVASSIKWAVGFLCACFATDDEHAHLRGLSADQLYQDADMTDDDDGLEADDDDGLEADDDDGLEAAGDDFGASAGACGVPGPGLASSPAVSARSLSTSASLGAAAR